MAGPKLLRAFLSFHPDASTAADLAAVQETLRQQLTAQGWLAQCRWIRPAQFHVTLVFLGPQTEAILRELEQGLGDILTDHGLPLLRLRGLGCFPALRQPRILWMGVDGGEGLVGLQEEMAHYLRVRLDLQPDRAFHPHLTLARVGPSQDASQGRIDWQTRLTELSEELALPTIQWRPGGISIMSSHLHSGGANYQIIAMAKPRLAK